MKQGKKKRTAILMALVMLASVAASTATALAEDASSVELTIERDGTTLQVSAVSDTDTSFGGIQYRYTYDTEKVNNLTKNSDVSSSIGRAIGNYNGLNRVTLDTGDMAEIAAGDALFTMNFSVDEFIYDTEYEFSVIFESAYNEGFTKYSWAKSTVAGTYAEYTVRFLAPDVNMEDTQYVVRGKTAEIPEDPKWEGHTFAGWELTEGNAKSVADPITAPTTFTAKWNTSQPQTPGGGDGPVAPTPTPTPEPEPTVIDEPEVPLAVPEGLNGEDHIAYVQGYEDGTVRPEGNITRAETATIIYRLLTAERRDEIFTAENSFSDVDADMWFNKAVSSMNAGEYINGYPDSTFKGNNNITRAEFVAIMARFLGGEGKAEFTDVPEGHWAKDYVAVAADAGWIAGYEDGTFRPDQPITRAEAMTIMNRVLKRGVDKDSELGSFKAFPDNADSSAWYYYEVIEAANSHEYSGERPSEQWTANGIDYHYDADKYERP